ncbi:carbohydrate-binding module family 14 protein [Actibacterium ureilyticum]|uniref:carbohydrate-binding module family 14 protein n=1 Tax=Actibacterium ureilyticum TaxID=1590614 RepID=UPI001140DA1E|nr:carbohydrate-binding module family 14 protein [Actibacterium ureilyticum]
MTIKTLISAFLLTVVPGLALAEGCSRGHLETSQCATGQFFDATTKTCVDKATS